MAIQTNGNERMDTTLRQALAPPAEQPIDDLAARMADAVAMLREIARYTTDYADNLQKGLVTYERGIQQRLGKVGK